MALGLGGLTPGSPETYPKAADVAIWDMGGCQNCGPFLGTLNIRCRIITGIQKRTITLTATHMLAALSLNPQPSLDICSLSVGVSCFRAYT